MKKLESLPFPPRIADAYAKLAKNPPLQAMLHRHIKHILEVVDEQRSDDAASAVMDAAVKAIADFDLLRAELAWVNKYIKWGLCTSARLRRPGAVRDAYLKYVRDYAQLPNLKQLAKFADLTTREVLAVWYLVAAELEIHPSRDTVIGSLPQSVHGALTTSLNLESLEEFFIRSSRLNHLDYTLILLTCVLGQKPEDIRLFASMLSKLHGEGISKQGLEAEIHAFACGFGEELGLLWTEDWLELQTRGQIRTRLHRALKALQKSDDNGPVQYFAA